MPTKPQGTSIYNELRYPATVPTEVQIKLKCFNQAYTSATAEVKMAAHSPSLCWVVFTDLFFFYLNSLNNILKLESSIYKSPFLASAEDLATLCHIPT